MAGIQTLAAPTGIQADDQAGNQAANIAQTNAQIENSRILQTYNINVNAVVTAMRVNGELGRALAGIS
jgi:hypothetical protein